MRAWCAGALGIVIAVAASGCQAQAPDEPDGFGSSVVALSAGPVYGIDEELHGRVLLVDTKGGVDIVETRGLYLGALSFDGSRLYASDAEDEVLVSADSVARLARDADHDMEWWSGVADGRRWTLFNDGTGSSDDYHTGVAVVDGNVVIEGDITGDVVGTSECDGQVVLAIGRWSAPRDHRGTRLVRLTADAAGVHEHEISRVVMPSGARVVNLTCIDDSLILLAMKGKRTLISRPLVNFDGPQHWSLVPERHLTVDGDSSVLGVVGTELLVWEPRMGVRALDLRTHKTRQVVTFVGSGETVGLDGTQLLAWDPAVPALRWYAVPTGEVIREITGGDVADVLAAHGETVSMPPVSLQR